MVPRYDLFRLRLQAQYTYIHDALAEYITCGDTSIEATSASVFKRMEELEKVTDHKTGYQRQFEVRSLIDDAIAKAMQLLFEAELCQAFTHVSTYTCKHVRMLILSYMKI